jgi:hypothetical protein
LWIEATYTTDGKNIAALVSQDLIDLAAANGCQAESEYTLTQGRLGRCWLNNIVSAKSVDMGLSFNILPPSKATVVTLGNVYPSGTHRRNGAFTSTNIVHNNGFYYVMVYVDGEGLQPKGNCLFRTKEFQQPSSWRAWDGVSFSVDMTLAAAPRTCMPIRGVSNEVRSISFVSAKKTWVAVFASRQKLPGDERGIPGFYYSTSKNLLDWSEARRIMPAATKPREFQNTFFDQYPSLIDPASTSRNFETIDSPVAILLFTRQNLRNGVGTMDRDLKYIKVALY